MTLEEAIIHAEAVADRCAVTDGNIKCEMEHRQLAEWLRKLQKIKEIYDNWNVDFGVGDQRALFSIGGVLNGNDESGSD